jgi:hypothetical protein
VKKTRQNKNREPRSDAIGTEKARAGRAETLLTPCWQQAFDKKGAGKLTGFRLRFERK